MASKLKSCSNIQQIIIITASSVHTSYYITKKIKAIHKKIIKQTFNQKSTNKITASSSSSVQRPISPRSRNMPILTYIRSNNRLSIIMEPEIPPQTERRMHIPRLFWRAKCAVQIDLAPSIVDRSPNPGLLEILEDTPEQHVIPLLLDVDASRPIADVEAIPLESAREQLIALLAAQIPNPWRQMRPVRPAYHLLPPLSRNGEIGLRFFNSPGFGPDFGGFGPFFRR